MIKLEIQSEDLAGREEHRSRVELITPETRSSWLASPDSITKLPGIGGAVDALGLADGPQSRGAHIALGRALGEWLAPCSKARQALTANIGDGDGERLRVHIVSSSAHFLLIPWELLILPPFDHPVVESGARIIRRLGAESPQGDADRYFAAAVEALQVRWLRLARAASRTPELLLEIPIVACDGPYALGDGESEFRSLLELDGDEGLVSGVDALDRLGLLRSVTGGRALDPRALVALSRRDPACSAAREARLLAALDYVSCVGFGVVAQKLLQRPADAIAAHLVEQREAWMGCFTRVAAGRRIVPAAHAALAMRPLLSRVGLADELPGAALQLLRDADVALESWAWQPHPSSAWVSLALVALGDKAAVDSAPIRDAARALEGWIETHALDDSPDHENLFEYAAEFLAAYFDRLGDFEGYRATASLRASRYRRQQRPDRLVDALKALSVCEHELGHPERAERLEREVLCVIQESELPTGTWLRSAFDFVRIRMRRGDTEGARTLLREIEGGHEPKTEVHWPREQLLAEIELREGLHVEAARRGCTLWSHVMQSGQGLEPGLVAQLLERLRSELGADAFDAIFDRCCTGVPSPTDLERLYAV